MSSANEDCSESSTTCFFGHFNPSDAKVLELHQIPRGGGEAADHPGIS